MKSAPIEERFWAKVAIAGPDECWEWQASRKRSGYGQVGVKKGKVKSAHRIAYELTKGDIPPGMHVCHSCDNPPCCNPAHLWLGTHQDNMRDMVSKSRQRILSGVTHKPSGGRTPVHLPFMRVMMFIYNKNVAKIAAETGIDIETVRDFTGGKFFGLEEAEKIAKCIHTDIAKLLAPGDVIFSIKGHDNARAIKRQTPGYRRYHAQYDSLSVNGEPEFVVMVV